MKSKEVTILLVEDDDIDAMGIEREFNKHRITNNIIRAKDGKEALELLQMNQIPAPYVVLLDLNMPRMSGLEFLEALRKDDQLRNTVVFILTTSKDNNDIIASYEQFIAGYFVKNETGTGFQKIVELLDGYWKIVYLPVTA